LEGGAVNLLSRSYAVYEISELGFQIRKTGQDEARSSDKAFRCSSHEMHIFGSVASGSSSVVHRAVHIPTHRILALKKINVFEKTIWIIVDQAGFDEKYTEPNFINVALQGKQEIDTGILSVSNQFLLLECPALIFHRTKENRFLMSWEHYQKPVAIQAWLNSMEHFALEYMDGGSLEDITRVKKFIPEPVLARMMEKVLPALRYLHEVKHIVHRDIKPENLLVNLKGDVKITDFGVTAGLHNSVSTVFYFLCATFAGTVTYMSPERIKNNSYSYASDIWSLGLTVLECATGRFPYCVNGGLSDLMLQILDDPSPTPAKYVYSPEFCSFISACLQKDADARPTCEQMLAIHYYLIFYGLDNVWLYMRTFYREESVFSFLGEEHIGPSDIFGTLSRIRKMLKGNSPHGKIVHVIEKVCCCAHGEEGVVILVSGSFIVGNELLVCEDGLQAEGMPSTGEGMPSTDEVPFHIMSKRVGHFREEFFMEPGNAMGCFIISTQKQHIVYT
ncbi:Mitogen-activated protein kinase kinase 3, partial [Dichanthelium oligosanthes]